MPRAVCREWHDSESAKFAVTGPHMQDQQRDVAAHVTELTPLKVTCKDHKLLDRDHYCWR